MNNTILAQYLVDWNKKFKHVTQHGSTIPTHVGAKMVEGF